ncbi:hypothetical protein BH10BAC6_BH10BAC6_01170 [soil metagenome]
MSSDTPASQILQNVALHTRIAEEYDKRHAEIYNEHEQLRLKEALQRAISGVIPTNNACVALDYGCGAGNLTHHLLNIGCSVVAADVTPAFLDLVRTSFDSRQLSTFLLNGADLSGIADATFDVVATYSVLHHVPDYLAILQEFARVLKPGGVVIIDHEACESYWNPSVALTEFQELTKKPRKIADRIADLSRPSWYVKKWRKLLNARYQEEGDIHVWLDDHIEWLKVREVLQLSGVHPIHEEDYLLHQAHYNKDVFDKFAHECSDMHLYIGRKR